MLLCVDYAYVSRDIISICDLALAVRAQSSGTFCLSGVACLILAAVV